jgi:hypothetical protein
MFNGANQLMILNKKQDIRYRFTLVVEVCVIYAIYILTQGAKHVKMYENFHANRSMVFFIV